jgi:hypothetical protein
MIYTTGAAVWLLLLIAAVPYVRRIRHPDQRPLAAYLIFVTVFGLALLILAAALGWLLRLFELEDLLRDPFAAVVIVALVCVPAFVVASWQARKPPSRVMPP